MEQTKARHLFHKQLEKHMISHAYLLVGKSDAFSFATYMAQSLLCETQNNGACGTCNTCLRVANQEHADVHYVTKEDSSIKKEDILSLKDAFTQTALEVTGKKIYIMTDVDEATISAMNSILKFLEEPDGDVIAILTTSNQNRVLETIQSRCMVIQLETQDIETLVQQGLEAGLDAEDARILAHIEDNITAMLEMSESQGYIQTRDLAFEYLEYLNQGKVHEAIIHVQVEGIKQKKIDKDTLPLFFDVVMTQNRDNPTPLNLQQQKIYLQLKDRIRPGVNPNLILDQLAYEMVKLYQNQPL